MLRDKDQDRRRIAEMELQPGPVRCIVGRTSLCRLRSGQSPDCCAAGEGVGGHASACRSLPTATRSTMHTPDAGNLKS